ncbi:MAG: hypothetical protein Q7N87_04645 [Candidatus Uhrbacteria bacterium]|nr:hypothetical protein [Candidatus Uhrbacteria bacterium]
MSKTPEQPPIAKKEKETINEPEKIFLRVKNGGVYEISKDGLIFTLGLIDVSEIGKPKHPLTGIEMEDARRKILETRDAARELMEHRQKRLDEARDHLKETETALEWVSRSVSKK